jgi:hypothetical protein
MGIAVMAKRPNGSRIAAKSRIPVDALEPKKRTFVAVRAQGGTITEAAAMAGVSRRMGSNYEKDEDVQTAYRDLIRQVLPREELAGLIAGGARATMPVFGSDGKKKKDRPDWKTRKPYIEMAREDAGYVERKANAANAPMVISVNVQHVGQQHLAQPTIIDASTENRSLSQTSAEAE